MAKLKRGGGGRNEQGEGEEQKKINRVICMDNKRRGKGEKNFSETGVVRKNTFEKKFRLDYNYHGILMFMNLF